jgi:hypothetical protein
MVVADVHTLQEAEVRLGMEGKLVGRVKHGLDAAAMMVLPDVKPHAEHVAAELNADVAKLWEFVKALHTIGPWTVADRLADKTDAVAQAYLVLSSSCQEAGHSGLSALQYETEKARIMAELAAFQADDLEARRATIQDRIGEISRFKVRNKKKSIRTVSVPVASGDPALPLAMDGEFGCVSQYGEEFAAQAQSISDNLLRDRELRPGFCEEYDAKTGEYKRVALNTPGARTVWVDQNARWDVNKLTPRAKRITDGFVWTYKDRDLALKLAGDAIRLRKRVELFKKMDKISDSIPSWRYRDTPERKSAYGEMHGKRLAVMAEHFDGTYTKLVTFPTDLTIPEGKRPNLSPSNFESPAGVGRLDVGNKTFLSDLNGGGTDLYVDGVWRGGNHDLNLHEIYANIDENDWFGING